MGKTVATFAPTVMVAPTAESFAMRAADWLITSYLASRHAKPSAPWIFCVATGHTPLAAYHQFAVRCAEESIPTDHIRIVHLDEYLGLSGGNPHSFAAFVQQHVVEPLRIPAAHVAYWHGDTAQPAAECARYAELVHAWGGIDTLVLGLGTNGHIAFNEPGTPLCANCHVVPLHPTTLARNAQDLGTATLPTHALTMGIGMILSAKQIILLASGAHKHAALSKLLLEKTPTLDFPASFLHTHPAVTIVTDTAAFGTLTQSLPRHTYEAA